MRRSKDNQHRVNASRKAGDYWGSRSGTYYWMPEGVEEVVVEAR
jgi:hypothetical protein